VDYVVIEYGLISNFFSPLVNLILQEWERSVSFILSEQEIKRRAKKGIGVKGIGVRSAISTRPQLHCGSGRVEIADLTLMPCRNSGPDPNAMTLMPMGFGAICPRKGGQIW